MLKKKKNPAFYDYEIYRGKEDEEQNASVETKVEIENYIGRNQNKISLEKKPIDFNKYDSLGNQNQKNVIPNIDKSHNTAESLIKGSMSSIDDIPDSYLTDNENNTDIVIMDDSSINFNENNNNNPEDIDDDYIDNLVLNDEEENQYEQDNSYQANNNENNYSPEKETEDNFIQESPIIEEKIRPNVYPKEQKPAQSVPMYNHSYGKYNFPPISLLSKSPQNPSENEERAKAQRDIINKILVEYGIQAHVKGYEFGPTVIVYLIEFDSLKENIKRLNNIEENLKMYLGVNEVRILTPIPGKTYCGIEVPYEEGKGMMIYLSDLLNSNEFKYSKFALPIAVGRTNFSENVIVDIEELPHGLCAGTTKSGKSVCLNIILLSLMYHLTPDDVRFIIVDPKIMEFNKYNDIPHLAMPVITEEQYFEPAIDWLVEEMERRKKLNSQYDCVNLKELNAEFKRQGLKKLPYLVMIMDEFNGWFCDAKASMKVSLGKILEQARAVGIHIILATQRPSADVIEGKIKANLGGRFAFRVTSIPDSTVILDGAGAEKLVGHGDMILRVGGSVDKRLQGAFASQEDIKEVLRYIKQNNHPDFFVTLEELLQSSTQREMGASGSSHSSDNSGKNDPKFVQVAYYVVRNNNASGNAIMQMENISWNRINDILNALAEIGVVSPSVKGTARKVLVNELELEEILKTL